MSAEELDRVAVLERVVERAYREVLVGGLGFGLEEAGRVL